MLENKFKVEKLRTIVAVIAIVLSVFTIVDIAIFYFKYSSVTMVKDTDYKKRANVFLQYLINDLNRTAGDNVELRERHMSSLAIKRGYLLKRDGGEIFRIAETTDIDFKVGDEFIDEACVGLHKHTFDEPFIKETTMTENRILVCAFDKIDDQLFGFKYFYTQGLSGMDDPNFKEWLVKNMSLTIFASFICSFILIAIFVYFILTQFKIKTTLVSNRIDKKAMLNEAKNQLYTDPLTRLSNKSALMRDLEAMNKAKIIIVDIDDFGQMNDHYGKKICDKILVYMANLMQDFAKNEKLKIYTISADQFALVENSDFDIDRYEELADELVNRFKGRLITIKDEDSGSSVEIEVHTTIGFALDADQTLIKATTALKMAKILKKDYVCYFKGLNKKSDYAEQIERSKLIRKAIINNNIVPFYQPIHDANGEILKYECLVRIVDSGEIVSPHIFLDTSKRIKRYAEVQKMIITKAVEALCENENLILSVNLGARDMLDGDVSALIVRLLNQHNVAERLVFELVEDENMENVDRIESFIDKVKNMGAKIAIDDFGSGYSNFSYILKLSPDYIKIDGALIKNIDINNDSYLITRAIVTFCHDLGIRTIAEYVHSKEVFEICKKLGVDEYQGFFLGVPTENIGR